MGGIKLPGNLHARRVTYRDAADVIIQVDRQALQRQILDALDAGPLQKWELRERLHVPEQTIGKEITRLRATGQIKQIGRQQLRVRWALASYEAPRSPPPSPDADTVVYGRKPAPAKDSWWTRALTREEFQERARRRADP